MGSALHMMPWDAWALLRVVSEGKGEGAGLSSYMYPSRSALIYLRCNNLFNTFKMAMGQELWLRIQATVLDVHILCCSPRFVATPLNPVFCYFVASLS